MTEPSGQPAPTSLPDIPECDVERVDATRLLVRHKTSGQTATAANEREARLAGIRLRIQADMRGAEMRPIPLPWDGTAPEFRAGYLP